MHFEHVIVLPNEGLPSRVPPDEIQGVWSSVANVLRDKSTSEAIAELHLDRFNLVELGDVISFLLWCNFKFLCFVVPNWQAEQREAIEAALEWISMQRVDVTVFLRKESERKYQLIKNHHMPRTGQNIKLRSVNWRIVRRCNAKCIFCNHWRFNDGKKQEFHLSKIIDLYHQFNDLGVKRIVLNGGEPLLHPMFAFAIRYGKELGMNIVANTNGITLTDAKFAKSIIDSGLDEVLISVHSSNPEIHNMVKNRQGSLEKTIRGIRILRHFSNSINIKINVVVTKANYHEALQIAELAVSLGVNSVQFSQVDELRHMINSHLRLDEPMQKRFYLDIYPDVIKYCVEHGIATKISPLPQQLLGNGIQKLGIDATYSNNVINSLQNPSRQLLEEIRCYSGGEYGKIFYAKHKCFTPSNNTYLMPNGDVYPCVRTIGYEDADEIVGNVYNGSISDILRSEKYLAFVSRAGKSHVCRTCKNLHGLNLYTELKTSR